MPTIGEMQHRIMFEQKTRGASDGAGGAVSETWSQFGLACWARLEPKAGREIVTADQVVHRVTHLVIIRARPGITPAMRVRYQGRILAILAMREYSEAGRFIELTCEETAPS